MRIALAPSLVLLAALAASAPAQEAEVRKGGVTVTTLSGDTVRGTGLTSITKDEVVLSSAGGPKKLPLPDVIALAFSTPPDPPRAAGPDEVIVDLWSGEEVRAPSPPATTRP